MSNDKDNVVSLFAKKAEKSEKEAEKSQEELDLEAIAKKNEEKRKRKEQERLSANKSVLRSYRIKN
jgi:hypothetical protein